MSKADYIRRKWMKLIHNGNEIHIVGFLLRLEVITYKQHNEFIHDTSMAYSNWWQHQSQAKNRIASRSYSKRPPSIIKPTGVRK